MSRLERAAAILEAAETWKQRCLLDGGSLFSDERLWTRECFGQLHTHFVERLDKGSGSFEEKLRTQLEPASPEAKRLWAEITWLYYLMVGSVKPLTKLDRIRTVWQWSGGSLPETHWALGDVLGRGIVNLGVGYLSHQHLEFRFIVTLMLEWCAHSIQERHTLLRDPWKFAEWLDAQKDARRRPFRHALLFLLFPDVFEPIMDAKYYQKSLGGWYGGKLHSNNLYQLLAYLRNREATEPPGPKHEGILLYPMVDTPLSADVCLEGFSIRARSIDLARDWRHIHADMLAVIA